MKLFCSIHGLAAFVVALVGCARAVASPAPGDDLRTLCADRTAVERVYYQHRTGEKLPFEQVLTAQAIRQLVERDQRFENALRNAYHVEVSREHIEAEVTRIESRTRAPEMLAELKAALGHDPERFARAIARPAWVERELRSRFENDDHLHAATRQKCESIRRRCLDAKAGGTTVVELIRLLNESRGGKVAEQTWDLRSRSQAARTDHEDRAHFEDLPVQLRRVLDAQLRQSGDISAVIESADMFLLFVAKTKSATELTTATLSIPKLKLETWLYEYQNNPR